MATTHGNCFICGKTAGKIAIKNHIVKEHSTGSEDCYLIKAEGSYDKNYWIYFSMALDASFSAVDRLLRQIWCECCGHLSAFRYGGVAFGKTRKVASLSIGDILFYEYDFGSTTEITLTIVDKISRQPQREKIQFLARNIPPEAVCDQCGAPATLINTWENEILCEKCSHDMGDDEPLLPIVNSPRCGECGYGGEQDKWTFDPSQFAQPEASRTASNRKRKDERISMEEAANKPVLTAVRRKLLKKYARATVNLYGIATLEDLVRIVNNFETEKTDIDEVAAVLNRSRRNIRDGFFSTAEYVINRAFFPDDIYRGITIYQEQRSKKRYIPATMDDFLQYADEDYFEPSEFADALYAFLHDEIFVDDEESAKAIFAELLHSIKSLAVEKGFLDRSMAPFNNRDHVWESQAQVERFMQLYMGLQSNTRTWWNCGNTPFEMRNRVYTMPQRPYILKSKKVGRNDPCPCGSGLKYKKCCGQGE